MKYLNKTYTIDGNKYSFKSVKLDDETISEIPQSDGVYMVSTINIDTSTGEALKINQTNNLQQQAKNAFDTLYNQYPDKVGFDYFQSDDTLERTNIVAGLKTLYNYIS